MVFGPPNSDKTSVALDFPKVYYIDVEGGATRPHYRRKLRDSGGVYFGKEEGSQDFRTVIDEITALATIQHDYLTLAIDSFSMLYNIAAAVAEENVGNDFGKDKKEAQKPTRQLLMWLERLDMNVVLICHEKDKWERKGKELYSAGRTFDGWEKMEYMLDLVIQTVPQKDRTMAKVHKTRIEGFRRDDLFPWSFAEFSKRAGNDIILRPSQMFDVATEEQVREVTHLVSVLKMDRQWEDQVFTKAGVLAWVEMPKEKIQKCIVMLKERLNPNTEGSASDVGSASAGG